MKSESFWNMSYAKGVNVGHANAAIDTILSKTIHSLLPIHF